MRLVLTAIVYSLCGCAWMPFVGNDTDNQEIVEEETSEQILYRRANTSLKTGNYSLGINRLQQLEARFPFGRYAEQGQLELIYAHYMSVDLDSVEASADRFIRLHPQHPNIDYAYYMRGLAAFTGNRSVLDRFFGGEESRRDMSGAQVAFAYFSEFLNRFPDSEYAKDAHQRMIYLRNLLAQAEVDIASYYLSRDAHVAAANRARVVVENYATTPSVPDALAILIESNYKLGLTDAADDSLRVLAINYPNYRAFDESGNLVLEEAIANRDRSWINIMTFGLVDRPNVPPPLQISQPGADGSTALPSDKRESVTDTAPRKPWYRRIFG